MKDSGNFGSKVYKRNGIVNDRMRGSFRFDRIFGLLAVILFLGTVSVFAGNVLVNQDGMQANYYSENGSEGLTETFICMDGNGGNRTLIFENGLLVNASGGASNESNESGPSFPSSGLVSYHSLDESSGTTAVDDYSTIDGTSNAGVTINQAGQIGTSYLFGNVNTAEVSFGTTVYDFQPGDDFSLSMWIKPNVPVDDTDRFLISRQDNDNEYRGWGLAVRTQSSTKRFAIENIGSTGTNAVYWNYDLNAQNGNWLHIVLTYDGTDTAKLYINNTEQTISSESGSWTGTLTSGVGAFLGNRESIDQGFRGNIDEVGVWSRILTSTEISDLYNDGDGLAYE